MSQNRLSLPSGKSEFNLEEAAALLGISSDELAKLVAERFDEQVDARKGLKKMRFRPADLIMLNFSRIGSD